MLSRVFQICLILILGISKVIFAQEIIPLYKNTIIPNSIIDTTQATPSYVAGTYMPTITVFKPNRKPSNGTGIIICSGGAYVGVADPVEGAPAALKLAESGITCFLLQYRVPDSSIMKNKEHVPVQDVQQAILYVREHAASYNLDRNRICIMGFSAGGHLVSTFCTHLSDVYVNYQKSINLRPDFMVLIYPVISFADSLTHLDSRRRLIGPDISPEKIAYFSNELSVSESTPPAFITHAIDDREVKVENSLYFAAALEQYRVPVQLFLYAKGGHAFGINNKSAESQWIEPCISWINENKWKDTNVASH